jgi:hypothetical protein
VLEEEKKKQQAKLNLFNALRYFQFLLCTSFIIQFFIIIIIIITMMCIKKVLFAIFSNYILTLLPTIQKIQEIIGNHLEVVKVNNKIMYKTAQNFLF